MSALAAWMARRLWTAMLWLLRRRWMKGLQRGSAQMLPPRMRQGARASIARQNRFARRYGLSMLTVSLNLLLASLALTLAYFVALHVIDSGALSLPERIRNK